MNIKTVNISHTIIIIPNPVEESNPHIDRIMAIIGPVNTNIIILHTIITRIIAVSIDSTIKNILPFMTFKILELLVGFTPTNVGFADRCVNYFTTGA